MHKVDYLLEENARFKRLQQQTCIYVYISSVLRWDVKVLGLSSKVGGKLSSSPMRFHNTNSMSLVFSVLEDLIELLGSKSSLIEEAGSSQCLQSNWIVASNK
ncbi:uncharacterized protein [Arachis hypogaea]|uniref:uncharacterized protein isoform X1 n=1 Tax=Arachis hypogaea TaxID=3818 RepID=UPI000DECB9D1|nr:uncharacterized protein LOC112743934 [Arachis hypogaea]